MSARYEEYVARIAACKTRNDAAVECADALVTLGVDGEGWPEINRAILARWSVSGLIYIKKRAWKHASQCAASAQEKTR